MPYKAALWFRQQAATEAAQGRIALQAKDLETTWHHDALKTIQAYRREEQGREKSRDWDLSRPDRLKLDQPARLPICSPLTLQMQMLRQDRCLGLTNVFSNFSG